MNHMSSRKKLYLVGIDGMSPKIAEKFIAEGRMPSISALINDGAWSKAIPSLPVFTPTNWATISTGARSGTHGVFLWGSHVPGEGIEEDHFDECMTSTICTAEYLWEAGLRQGRKSVLLNYIGYPSDQDGIYHVDWFYGPNRDYFGLATCCVYIIGAGEKRRESRWEKWAGLWDGNGTVRLDVPFSHGQGGISPKISRMDGEGKIRIEAGGQEAELAEGEWSGWFHFDLESGRASVRWKLLPKAPGGDGRVTRIYRSSIYIDSDFCSPGETGRELVRRLGPYINDDVGKLYLDGLVDRDTFLEETRYKFDWIAGCFRLMEEGYDVSMFFLHWHYVDSVQHAFLGRADRTGGDYGGGADEEKAVEMLREGYMLADELTGKLLAIAGPEDAFVVVSDHGNIPNHHRVSLCNLFMEKGWMKIDVAGGAPKVDLAASRVVVNLSHVYISLKGRDPEGIVEEGDYTAFREEVRSAILSVRDPDTDLSPFASVLRKEEASVAGVAGDGTGDIVLVFDRGYVWSGSEVVTLGEKRIVWKTGGANHGSQPPTAETEFSSNFATFIARGHGVRKGYRRRRPIFLTDVVPAACRILGIEVTAQCEGSVPLDIFDGNVAVKSHRSAKAKYQIRRKELVIPKTFKGDVTDE